MANSNQDTHTHTQTTKCRHIRRTNMNKENQREISRGKEERDKNEMPWKGQYTERHKEIHTDTPSPKERERSKGNNKKRYKDQR